MTTEEIEQTWRKYRNIPEFPRVLWLMNKHNVMQISDIEIDSILALEDERERAIAKEEKFWYKEEKKKIREAISILMSEVDEDFKKDARKRYIEQRLAEESEYLRLYNESCELRKKQDVPFKTRDILAMLWDIESTKERIWRLQRQSRFLEVSITNKSELTQEKIDRARDYPIDSLLDFNYRGFRQCPYHQDNSPSFSYWKKNNLAHCFGCGTTADSIKIVMDAQKKTFPEAVYFLLGL